MARVAYPQRDDLPEEHRPIYDRMQRERGVPTSNIFLALANTPLLLDGVLTMAGALRRDTIIDRRFRELAVLMVGLRTKCEYEFTHHSHAALEAGVSRAQIEALAAFETSDQFEEREKAVLRFASEITVDGNVQDSTWEAIRRFFSIREAMEIQLTAAWYNCVARILLPLRIEQEEWFKPA